MISGMHPGDLTGRLCKGDFHRSPFPYAFTPNFLPDDIYRGVEAHWPSLDRFDREGGGYNKIRYRMGRDRVEKELAAEQPAWLALHRHLTEVVFPDLESLIDPIAQHRLGASQAKTDWDYILTTDLPGNHFGIHVDPPQRIFSGLLYIGSPDSAGLPGTTIYRLRQPAAAQADDLKALGLGHYNDPQEKSVLFEAHDVLDFRANSAFLFANCDQAWHGVEHNGSGTRRLIHIVYRVDLEPLIGVDNATLNANPTAAADAGISELRRQLDHIAVLQAFDR